MTDRKPNVYVKILQVANGLHIGKDQENKFQHYKFRGIDQAMNALNPRLVETGLVLLPRYKLLTSEKLEKGWNKTVELTLIIRSVDDLSETVVTTIGEGSDTGDKAVYKAMAGALKYAILQTFCIPTEEQKDAEFESPVDYHARITAAQTRQELKELAAEIKTLPEEQRKELRKPHQAAVERLKGTLKNGI